jgi:hypothetical protein
MRRDFHGSRTYERDEPAVGQTSLALAWFFSGTRRRLKKFLLWAAPPSSSRTLLNNGERRFSQLGARPSKQHPVRAADCPLPKKPARPSNDWRVLP